MQVSIVVEVAITERYAERLKRPLHMIHCFFKATMRSIALLSQVFITLHQCSTLKFFQMTRGKVEMEPFSFLIVIFGFLFVAFGISLIFAVRKTITHTRFNFEPPRSCHGLYRDIRHGFGHGMVRDRQRFCG
jgi:hypothetical protein